VLISLGFKPLIAAFCFLPAFSPLLAPAEVPMRLSRALLCLTLLAALTPSVSLRAQEVSAASARMSARRELELAKIDLRHYWQVEYPRQQRHLNAAIDLTRAEIRDLKARLRAYQPFTRFSTGDPFMVTIQQTEMCLREAELRLRDLWAERNALVRFHSDQWRELELRVSEARFRVAELEADEEDSRRPIDDQAAI
jgi:hypothetical protein